MLNNRLLIMAKLLFQKDYMLSQPVFPSGAMNSTQSISTHKFVRF